MFGRPVADPFVGSEYSRLASNNFNFQRFGCDVSKPGIAHESPVRTVNYAGLPTPNADSRFSKMHFPESSILASPFSGARGGLGLGNGELPCFAPKSRAFAVEGVSPVTSHLAVASLFSVGFHSIPLSSDNASFETICLLCHEKRREFESIQGPYLSELNTVGKFVVSFTDLRDTQRALDKVQLTHPEWRITPLLAREYAQESQGSAEGISNFEGQVSIKIILRGNQDNIELSQMSSLVQGLVKSFGAVNAFKATSFPTTTAKEFLVEFCDTTDSANAVAVLSGACIEVSSIFLFIPSLS